MCHIIELAQSPCLCQRYVICTKQKMGHVSRNSGIVHATSLCHVHKTVAFGRYWSILCLLAHWRAYCYCEPAATMLTGTHSKLSSKLSSVRRPGNLTSFLFVVNIVYRFYYWETNTSQNYPILHTHMQTFIYYLGYLSHILPFT